METQGTEAARPWVDKAGAEYPVTVDRHNLLGRVLDFKAVPNGVFLDERGVIRYTKYGGFSVERSGDVETIRKLIGGEIEQQIPSPSEAQYILSPVDRELVETRLRLGNELLSRGSKEEAILEWQRALELDPENLIIRKQIWAVRYPERFHPTIDWDWQGEQLRREREEEIERGVCGPDGCPIPREHGE